MNDKLKIAIFHNLAFGGALRVVFEHVRYLAQYYSIDLFTYDFRCKKCNIYLFEQSQILNIEKYCNHIYYFLPPIIDWPKILISRYTNPYLKAIDLLKIDKSSKKLAEYINRQGYAAIIVHPDRITQAPLFIRYLKVPSVYYLHEPNRYIYDVYQHYELFKRANKRFLGIERLAKLCVLYPYRKLLKYFDYVNTVHASLHLTNSKFSKEFIEQVYRVNCKICYPGVDIETFRPLSLPKEDQVVFVSALLPSKAQDFAIQSLALIPKSRRPKLVLCYKRAESRFLEKLKSLAQRTGVRLKLIEGASDKEIVEIYNRSLFALYLPIREPFGLVPLEAMACGIPVVGVNEGGVTETIINGQTGFLVDRNLEKLAETIDILIKNENLRNMLGANARKHVVANWTWDKSGSALDQEIRLLLSGKET